MFVVRSNEHLWNGKWSCIYLKLCLCPALLCIWWYMLRILLTLVQRGWRWVCTKAFIILLSSTSADLSAILAVRSGIGYEAVLVNHQADLLTELVFGSPFVGKTSICVSWEYHRLERSLSFSQLLALSVQMVFFQVNRPLGSLIRWWHLRLCCCRFT